MSNSEIDLSFENKKNIKDSKSKFFRIRFYIVLSGCFLIAIGLNTPLFSLLGIDFTLSVLNYYYSLFIFSIIFLCIFLSYINIVFNISLYIGLFIILNLPFLYFLIRTSLSDLDSHIFPKIFPVLYLILKKFFLTTASAVIVKNVLIKSFIMLWTSWGLLVIGSLLLIFAQKITKMFCIEIHDPVIELHETDIELYEPVIELHETDIEPHEYFYELHSDYWKAVLGLIRNISIVWFLVSYGCGILFAPLLNSIHVGGYPLGFWFAQQGSMYIFVALIFIYAKLMDKIDKKFDVQE